MVDIQIRSIVRYPFKGFSPEHLVSTKLCEGESIYGDRRFAFSKQKDKSHDLGWLGKQRLVCLMEYPKLARLKIIFVEDVNQISVELGGQEQIKCILGEVDQVSALESYVSEYVGLSGCRLLDGFSWKSAERGRGHYCDNENNYISIVNSQTVAELSRLSGKALDLDRFRANLYLSGLESWQERNWVGKTIKINDCILFIESEISRCRAVSVDLSSGEVDIFLPKILLLNYQHDYCGVFARVKRGGRVEVGDGIIEII